MQIASTGVENAVSFTSIVSANTAIGRKALFRKAPMTNHVHHHQEALVVLPSLAVVFSAASAIAQIYSAMEPREAATSIMKVEIANRPAGLLFANEFKTGDTARWSRNGGPRNE
jgi:hypothetical protein